MNDITRTKTRTRTPTVASARMQDLPVEMRQDAPLVARPNNLPGMGRTAGQLMGAMNDVPATGGRGAREEADTPTTLPAVISKALSNARKGVDAYRMSNIIAQWPPRQRAQLASAGRELFSQHSERKLSMSDIFTVCSLTNSETEVKKMAAWVVRHCVPVERDIEYSFPAAPGYKPKAELWDGDGVRFLLVRETPKDFGEDIDPAEDVGGRNLFYIYGWTEPSANAHRLGGSEERKALAEAIEPDNKDAERAGGHYSSAQVHAMAKAIKDPQKALRRGIAFARNDSNYFEGRVFRDRAQELGATDDQLKEFDDLVAEASKKRSQAFQEEENRKRKAMADAIPAGLARSIGGDQKVSVMWHSRRRTGRIYNEPTSSMSGFHGEAYYFYPVDSDKRVLLGENFHTIGLSRYEAEIGLITKYQIKSVLTESLEDLRDEVRDVIDNAVDYYYDDVKELGHDDALELAIDYVNDVANEPEIGLTAEEKAQAKGAIRKRINESSHGPNALFDLRESMTESYVKKMEKALKAKRELDSKDFPPYIRAMAKKYFAAPDKALKASILAEVGDMEKRLKKLTDAVDAMSNGHYPEDDVKCFPKDMQEILNDMSMSYEECYNQDGSWEGDNERLRLESYIGRLYGKLITMAKTKKGTTFEEKEDLDESTKTEKMLAIRESARVNKDLLINALRWHEEGSSLEETLDLVDTLIEDADEDERIPDDELARTKDAIKDAIAKGTTSAEVESHRFSTFVCVGSGRVEIIEGAEAMSAEALEGNKFIVNPNYRGGEDENRFYGKLDIGRNSFRVDPGLSGKRNLETNVNFGKVVYAIRKATIDAEPSDFWATWRGVE